MHGTPFESRSSPVEAARAAFERLGLRCTRQRMDIYEALRACCSHPTAEELFSVVRREQPGLSLATVYNTLEVLCSNGLCRKVASSDSVSRYDADMRDHVHVTTPEGGVHDVPEDLGDRILGSIPQPLLDQIAQRLGMDIRGVRIDLLGSPRPSPSGAPNGP